jgi:hypothetical protein
VSKRALPVAAVAAVILFALAGCQATPGAFLRASAQADVVAWTKTAESAAGSPTATIRFDGYEKCRTDNGFFTMTFQWRTITDLAVASSEQSSVTADISREFSADGWAVKAAQGLVTITGPTSDSHRGLVQIQTAGDSQLAVSVTSPCYS